MKLMKKINFKKVTAKNFLCFGSEGIEIDFEKYNNIILVKGKNLDTSKKGEEARLSSNGSGKSSIPEMIVYGLFGKTIKNPKKISHKDVMHVNASKNLCVEIYWDDYKVERKRKPDSLRLWKDPAGKYGEDTEMTLGGMPATQGLIEDILGLNYQTFINIFIFTDDNSSSFLECDAAEKRNIVENLLSLEKYRGYHENAKLLAKEHQTVIKNAQMNLDYASQSLSEHQKNLESLKLKKQSWAKLKIDEINKWDENIKIAQGEIIVLDKNDDLQKYEDAQKKIAGHLEEMKVVQIKLDGHLSEKVVFDLESTSIKGEQRDIEQQKHNYVLKKQELAAKGKQLAVVLEKIRKLESGVKCDHCFGTVDPSNYVKVEEQHKNDLEEIKKLYAAEDQELKKADGTLQEIVKKHSAVQGKISSCLIEISKCESALSGHRTQISLLQKIQPPDSSKKKAGLEEKIKLLNESIAKAKGELDASSPYEDMIAETTTKIESSKQVIDEKNANLVELKQLSDYYSFWTVAFGDSGIRKYVIDEIIPALNANVNYWLSFLIDNKLQIQFDNELNETISKYPEEKNLLYHVLSNGQRRRINLALSQSFAHVMSLNTGRFPSLVFLDEVTTNIDPVGVEGIYNMICELSKDKQVIVTTHDHDLLELLNGCQELNLRMQDGVSFLEK